MQRSITRLAAIAGLLLLFTNVKSQYAWDFGVHVGAANYLGEIGGKDEPRRDFVWDMKMQQTRLSVGGFARRRINRLLSVNAGLMYLRIQGADELTDYGPRAGRNLNFRNDMFELYLRPEFTIFQDNDLGGRGRYKTDFRLFGYAGIAALYHNPQGQLNREGEFYDLRPLRTELVDYSNLTVAIPAGIGFHFTKKRRHRFGWDIGWRTTFTDYIDDVSTTYKDPSQMTALGAQFSNQNNFVAGLDGLPHPENYGYGANQISGQPENVRGDPTHNDSYLTMTLTYSYVLRGQSNFYRQRYNWVRGTKRVGRKSRAKF